MGELCEQNLAYSSINMARSALSTVIFPEGEHTFKSHPLVTKFLKGVYSTRPSLPANVPVEDIMTTAGWSNAETFRKFYDKPVQVNTDTFGCIVKS